MKALLIIIALMVLPASGICSDLPAKALDVMGAYSYVREQTNRNDHPVIDRWLKNLGLPKGLSWCMAAVIGCYDEAAGGRGPLPRSGRCATVLKLAKKDKFRYQTLLPNQIISGVYPLQPGDVVIWKNGKIDAAQDFNGHTGLIIKQLSPTLFQSREGNTTPGPGGNQADGGGLYDRTRGMGFGQKFQVMGFIRVRQ